MTYTERHLKVLREFRVIDQRDRFIERHLLRPEEKPMGMGPVLEPKAANRLIAADDTEGQVWLEWIFNEAAGGATAKESSERALEQMKQRFMDERLHGYQHARTGEIFPKMSKEEAERRWLDTEPKFREVLFNADQDSVEKLGVWGFYRHWPGKDGIYEQVAATVQKWQALRPKVEQMNDDIVVDGKERVALGPDGIANLEALTALVKKVERYFASKAARIDIRLAQWKGNDYVYNDDFIMALVPLTYASAVRYGHDGWQWANRDTFERVLLDDQSFADAWKSGTQRGSFYVYLRFKCPVPRWVARKSDKFFVHELTNLALELSKNVTSKDFDEMGKLVFWDEEGRNTMRFQDICKMIRQEVNRPMDEEKDMPIKRGQNVYKTAEEAEQVIEHLTSALQEVLRWAVHFNHADITSDALATLNAELRAASPS